MYGYIYIIHNHITGTSYVGKHKSDNPTDSYFGSGLLLLRAIAKYGKENFSKEILDIANDINELNMKETLWIKHFNATKNNSFYNIAEGGQGGNVMSGLSEDERKRIYRRASKTQKSNYNKQRFMTKSEISKQNWKREEYRQKQIERLKGNRHFGDTSGSNNGMYGKHHSEESKKKISENGKGKHTNTYKVIKNDEIILFNSRFELFDYFKNYEMRESTVKTLINAGKYKPRLKKFKHLSGIEIIRQ